MNELNEPLDQPDFFELHSSEAKGFEMTRRELLRAFGGGVLVLATGSALVPSEAAQRGGTVPQEINAWLHIAPDGKVTAFTGKVEVGQNARTSLTQAIAEELRVATASVHLVMGDTDLVPYDMGTFGSRTTPTMVPQLRRAAAAAREALLDLAAKKMGVDRGSLRAENGRVSAGSASMTYGELAKGQPIDKPILGDIALTSPADWRALGTSVLKVGGREIVTGKHEYAADLRRPGMLYAKVLRRPSIGATLESADLSAAQAMARVKIVRDGDFVGVAAPTLRDAEAALQAIKPVWKEIAGLSSVDLYPHIRGTAIATETTGSPAEKSYRATYTAAYIAHVPLEPRAALAEWDGSKLTVWTGTQRPFGVKPEVAAALGIPEYQVRVIVPDTGSGYGGKHTGDAAVEAARMAKALGKPVKVVWTRSEEFRFAYFRPAGVAQVTSGAGADGLLSHWEFDNYNSGSAALQTPYDVASPRADFHEAASPLRQGSYRGLAATFNNFARETHMDELAHSLGMDPLELRLKNLKNPRLVAVVRAAADRFGWGKQKPENGHGFGLACGTEKGGCVATVVEIAVDSRKAIQVVRAVTAFECGAILNPDQLRNQVEGAVIMGLGGALFEAIEFGDGRLSNGSLSRYRVPRFRDVPLLETLLLDRRDLPSAGAGECPIIAIAPAIGNAVFVATGVRLRSMPLRLA